jgi:hypothetical protein
MVVMVVVMVVMVLSAATEVMGIPCTNCSAMRFVVVEDLTGATDRAGWLVVPWVMLSRRFNKL